METNRQTGWERSNRSHFDDFVGNYDAIRPEYPVALFDDVFEYVISDTSKNALEIGAGTGKATTPFLEAGFSVTAVEIGISMGEFLRNKFINNRQLNVINSAFEDALLDESSYDLIYAGSAFHWVDAEIGCPKALSLLKNKGAIALFRYNEISIDNKELNEAIQEAYKLYFHKPYIKPAKKERASFNTPERIQKDYGFSDLGSYGFTDVTMKLYDVIRTYSADEFIAFRDTLADHRSLPDGDRAALYSSIKNAIQKHGGFLNMDYVFQLYMGRKP